MEPEDNDEIPDDHEVFDVSQTKIEYHRSKDSTRVTILIKDPNTIGELKLYLLLVREIELLERRLGIFDRHEVVQ